MIKTIDFNGQGRFSLGRNGLYKTIGIELWEQENRRPGLATLVITGITSRKKLARGDIHIPTNKIPELIEALQELYDGRNSNH